MSQVIVIEDSCIVMPRKQLTDRLEDRLFAERENLYRSGFFDYRIQVLESLCDGERVHFAAYAFTGFQCCLQIMSCDLDCQFVSDDLTGATLIFVPCGQRQGDRDGASTDEEVNVHGIGVARGNGNDQRLVNAVHFLFRPAVDSAKAFVHDEKTIAERVGREQTVADILGA